MVILIRNILISFSEEEWENCFVKELLGKNADRLDLQHNLKIHSVVHVSHKMPH